MSRGKRAKNVAVPPRTLEEEVLEEKTKHCIENGWAPTQENFDKIELWNVYGRIDNYMQGVNDTWAKLYHANIEILRKAKGNGCPASELNRIQREANP